MVGYVTHLQKKYLLYQSLGVKEYYVFDPEYDYLKDQPLIAYHLTGTSFELSVRHPAAVISTTRRSVSARSQ